MDKIIKPFGVVIKMVIRIRSGIPSYESLVINNKKIEFNSLLCNTVAGIITANNTKLMSFFGFKGISFNLISLWICTSQSKLVFEKFNVKRDSRFCRCTIAFNRLIITYLLVVINLRVVSLIILIGDSTQLIRLEFGKQFNKMNIL